MLLQIVDLLLKNFPIGIGHSCYIGVCQNFLQLGHHLLVDADQVLEFFPGKLILFSRVLLADQLQSLVFCPDPFGPFITIQLSHQCFFLLKGFGGGELVIMHGFQLIDRRLRHLPIGIEPPLGFTDVDIPQVLVVPTLQVLQGGKLILGHILSVLPEKAEIFQSLPVACILPV